MNELIPRPGLYKRWGKVEAYLKQQAEEPLRLSDAISALQIYVNSGEIIKPWDDLPVEKPVTNASLFANNLSIASNIRLAEAEIESVKTAKIANKFNQALAYLEIKLLCELRLHTQFPSKFSGRNLQKFSPHNIPDVAFAFALGVREIGVRLAEIMLVALKCDYFFAADKYPIFHFILRLYCDWQGKPYPLAQYPTHPIMEGLLAEWRSDDLARLTHWLLAACDHHTHRARSENSKEFFFEFDNEWRFYPIEILMVLRLRQYLGLPNPELDHPIMKFPWSLLPAETTAEPDALLQAVLQRAKQDEGFDPDALYQELVLDKIS